MTRQSVSQQISAQQGTAPLSPSDDTPRRRVRKFTGWHMLTILVAFFGVVIAVNVMMAHYALSTFSGEVVENSYVASQRFNGWLDEAKAERALGWKVDVTETGNTLSVAFDDRDGKPITGAKLTADATHPLGDETVHGLRFVETKPGIYVAPLASGRWQVHLLAEANGHRLHNVTELAGGGSQ